MKKKRPFLFDLGSEFEEMFREFEKIVMEDFERIFEELSKQPNVQTKRYGISIKVGPDGKVYIRKFGDVPKEFSEDMGIDEEYKKPFVDVSERDDAIYITAELPGVKEDEIEYNLKEGGIEIKTKGEKKYKVFIPLPENINKNEIQKNFSNGILEVIIKRSLEK